MSYMFGVLMLMLFLFLYSFYVQFSRGCMESENNYPEKDK